MQNIVGYVQENLLPFERAPFGAVDSLVLSQLCYLRLERAERAQLAPGAPDATVRGLLRAELFPHILAPVRDPAQNRELLFAAAASPRFRDVRLLDFACKFDPQEEKQFFAETWLLPDGTAYVAFRGTDATLVGWKEDFNMAFISPIPAQLESVAYLNGIAAMLPDGVRTGGHSKGGNLAVYSAAHCEDAVQRRILAAFSHDGPGFMEAEFSTPEYLRIGERVRKTLPQSSLIGMLLESQESYTVVQSNRFWISQHDPFSWEVQGTDFVRTRRISRGAALMDRSINQWLLTLSSAQRALFVDSLYQVLAASGAKTFADLSAHKLKEAAAILSALRDVDPDTRKFLSETLKSLAKMALSEFVPETPLHRTRQ